MKFFTIFLFVAITMTGCAKFHDSNTSVWSEIFWIPWLAGIIAAFCWYKVYFYKTKYQKWNKWYLWVGGLLTIGIIAMIIGVYGSR